MEKARKLTYMHNTPKTPSQTTPQEGERILSLLESFEIFGGFFSNVSECFEQETKGGIYTRSGGARVRSLGIMGLQKFRFSDRKTWGAKLN